MSAPAYRPLAGIGPRAGGWAALRERLARERSLHLMVLPSILVAVVIHYLAMYGLIIAFKRYDIFQGILASPWATHGGFEHFIDFFQSPNVAAVLRNTVAIALLKLVFLSFPPVLFAIFLNEIGNRPFKLVTQTISYLPHFISWVVLGGIMITFFLRTPDAPFNRVLFALGAIESPTDVLNRPGYVWPVFVLSHLWKEVGWSAIIYLAVIASIDAELYEAAEVDGGGRLVKMLNITWPALKGTFMILFILACGQIMAGLGASFDQSYVLGTPSNRSMSQILDVYIVRIGLDQGRHSFATAVGLMKNVVNLLLLLSANWLSWRLTGKGLF